MSRTLVFDRSDRRADQLLRREHQRERADPAERDRRVRVPASAPGSRPTTSSTPSRTSLSRSRTPVRTWSAASRAYRFAENISGGSGGILPAVASTSPSCYSVRRVLLGGSGDRRGAQDQRGRGPLPGSPDGPVTHAVRGRPEQRRTATSRAPGVRQDSSRPRRDAPLSGPPCAALSLCLAGRAPRSTAETPVLPPAPAGRGSPPALRAGRARPVVSDRRRGYAGHAGRRRFAVPWLVARDRDRCSVLSAGQPGRARLSPGRPWRARMPAWNDLFQAYGNLSGAWSGGDGAQSLAAAGRQHHVVLRRHLPRRSRSRRGPGRRPLRGWRTTAPCCTATAIWARPTRQLPSLFGYQRHRRLHLGWPAAALSDATRTS